MILEQILERFPESEFLKADGFDDAIMGFDIVSERLIYSYGKMINIFKKEMDEDEAVEYLDFNTLNAFVGEKTPIYMWDLLN